MRSLFLIIFLLVNTVTSAQYTDRYWAFGDSAGIDFKNLSNPQPANSILRVRGTCASICDSAGDLLFYCGSPNWIQWLAPNNIITDGTVINKNHQVFESGDSLVGALWYQEMVIVPKPGVDSLFYIFAAGVTTAKKGLFYSIVDLNYNNGQGRVIQKNVQLRNDYITDCITAVRHGNGRDWWVLVRSWSSTPTNDITAYLVSPSGVTAMPTQYIGPNVANASAYRLKFNKQGNHLFNVCQIGGVERYDFDRCTGILSNRNIYAVPNVSISGYWDFEISEDETKMYAVRNMLGPLQNTTKLFQYDLDTVTFLSNAQLMATYTDPDVGGALKMGPNGKIYFSIGYFGANDTCFDYLYCYSTTNLTNTNLSVINYPDSTFPACDYQAFSFYLGGHKAYFGLPNNPHYELGKWVGSPCDTLSVGIPELFQRKGELKLYYDKSWQTVFVNAEQLKGRTGKLQFYSTNGQLVDEVSIRPDGGYFTYSSSFAAQPAGVYIVRLQTEKEVLTGKFVKW
ncbi:MAG: T9SS type A sorting domain-containing protein [Bacteroidia bacterium]|nr:T9SS type A sorting domain-containing protein [Bacteroidia bacterium]